MKNHDATLVLKKLVEAHYRQKPLPKTSIVFKMAMIESLEYLKEHKVDLPYYDAFKAEKARLKTEETT